MADRARIEIDAGPAAGGLRFSRLNPFGEAAPRGALIDQPTHPLAAFVSHPLTLQLLSALLLCIAWEWAGRIPISPAFPTFGETMIGLWSMLADFSLIRACGIL